MPTSNSFFQSQSAVARACTIILVLGPVAECSAKGSGDKTTEEASAFRVIAGLRASLEQVAEFQRTRMRGECPDQMVRISEFCIDRFEAHVVEVVAGKDQAHPYNQPICPDETSAPKTLNAMLKAKDPCDDRLHRLEARSRGGVFPQGYISQVQASQMCINAGKRLCTRPEWMRACQGSMKNLYPYGGSHIPGTCNSGKPHVLTMFHGPDPFEWTPAAFNDARLNAEPGFLAKTGAYRNCVSADDAFDMVGNVQEWVSDRVEQGEYKGRGVFVGGHFGNPDDDTGAGCHSFIRSHAPDYHDYSVGFRCCTDSPP